jgi:threonylcarbamoyladenosine tRNA methylthiotransferase MtaB
VNQAEAFTWVDELQKNGLSYIDDAVKSDLIIVNTCTLTSRADRDVQTYIRRVAKNNPQARLVLTGCYAERDPEDLHQDPKIWRVFSNTEKEEMVNVIISLFGERRQPSRSFYKSRAPVKIQDGCDLACHFCVIPKVRGRSVSREREDIQHQVKQLVGEGFEEIVLTGVHLCLYGRDMTPKTSLLQLLESLEDIDGLGRIRLSSLDPRFLDKPLLDHISASRKICPHFHLSLQHGSKRILEKMGRNIGPETYLSIMTSLRQKRPEAALGADIIVGFPEETEEDFEQTRVFLQESPLAYFHVFSYSPRPGTEAAGQAQVDERIKKQRGNRLRILSDKKRLVFQKDFIGKILDAVVIEKEDTGARVLTGNYLDVFVPGCQTPVRKGADIRITRVEQDRIWGETVQTK